ncbi:MAG: MFS transporter, partial [Alphaproteobacteria bacterium]|nr:MFS transporter [Alphaproteobacteria bacterium]
MNFSKAAARARARVRLSVRKRRRRASAARAVAAETQPGQVPPTPEAFAPPPKRTAMSHAEVRRIFFGIMLATFLAALNQTIVATAMPTIGRHYGDFENLSWVVTAYLLTSTAVAPLYGKLADIWGRSAMIHTAIGIFMAGSVLSAAAPDMLTLILGRALQGIGGGGILPVAQSVIADVVAPRERGRYQAYMGVVWVTAGIGGPVLGGVFAEHLHWTLIFWINVPLALGAALLTHIHLRRIPRNERMHKLDWLGAGLMMASAIPLLLAFTWGGTRFPWSSAPILMLIGGSFVLSFLFGWRLVRAPEPFLPMTVLANPVMRWGTTSGSLSMGVQIGLTIMIPLYFETVHRLTASESGFALIPIALTTPGSLLSGQAMLYWRHYKRAPVIGMWCALLAMAFLVWKPDLPLIYVIVILCVVGTAIGLVFPVTTVSIQNAVPHHQVGIAMGALNFFRQLASAFVVAMMGAILLAGLGVAPERAGRAVSVVSEVSAAASGDVAFVFRWVFLSAFVCLALALAALIAMEERPLRTTTAPAEGPPPAG